MPKNIKGRKTLDLFGKDIKNLDFSGANLFDYEMRKKLFSEDSHLRRSGQEKKVVSKDLIKSLTFEDYNNYLSEEILVKVDRASMASSLELRSPFLYEDTLSLSNSFVEGEHINFWNKKRFRLVKSEK
mgnify:CR=1 FL=1